MSERRRAVELARHIREVEGRSIAQVAERLGRSPARVKAYFYDPTGEKARAVRGDTSACAAAAAPYTQPRNGKGDAYRYCKRCHPGGNPAQVDGKVVLEWQKRDGRLLSSYDWSAHACETPRWHRGPAAQRGGVADSELRQRARPQLGACWRSGTDRSGHTPATGSVPPKQRGVVSCCP